MSRASDPKSGDMGLSTEAEERLYHRLELELSNVQPQILEKISEMQLSESSYGLVQPSEEIVISVNFNGKSSISLNIGYPFPIGKKYVEAVPWLPGGCEVCVHCWGECVRAEQRDYTARYLEAKCHSPSWLCYGDETEFGLSFSRERRGFHSKIIYVDPYSFIGDSLIGLSFLDSYAASVRSPVDAGECVVFSKNFNHLSHTYEALPIGSLSKYLENEDCFTIIYPNLIDNQFSLFLNLVDECAFHNCLMIVPSRNIYFVFSDGNVRCHYLNADDVLFRDKDIDSYMSDCLHVFVAEKGSAGVVHRAHLRRPQNQKHTIFVNPRSSTSEKDLPASLCAMICRELLECGHSVLMNTLSTDIERTSWVSAFDQETEKNGVKAAIQFLDDEGLSDLWRQLHENGVDAAITVDTGLAHLLGREGVCTTVIYQSAYWDPTSVRSLCADSPLGFGRSNYPLIPFVLDDEVLLKDASLQILRTFHVSTSAINCQTPLHKTFGDQVYSLCDNITQLGCIQSDEAIGLMHERLKKQYAGILEANNGNIETTGLLSGYNPGKILDKIVGINSVGAGKEAVLSGLIRSAWRNLPIFKLSQIIGHCENTGPVRSSVRGPVLPVVGPQTIGSP